MRTLITGCQAGLGKSLLESLPSATGLNRENCKDILDSGDFYESIVHCAFSRSKSGEDLNAIIKDNILLTEKLLNLNYKKFIFISSVDIYSEDKNLYNSSKIFCESMVEAFAANSLIIRCGALIGANMRSNSLTRLLAQNPSPKISLHPESSFYYILHSDVASFIKHSLKNDLTGTIDFVSSSPITLREIGDHYPISGTFGSYLYKSPIVSNKKLQTIFPQVDKSSLAVIKEFTESV